MSRNTSEVLGVYRGLEYIFKALIEIQSKEVKNCWNNSSLKTASENTASWATQNLEKASANRHDITQRVLDSVQLASQQTSSIKTVLNEAAMRISGYQSQAAKIEETGDPEDFLMSDGDVAEEMTFVDERFPVTTKDFPDELLRQPTQQEIATKDAEKAIGEDTCRLEPEVDVQPDVMTIPSPPLQTRSSQPKLKYENLTKKQELSSVAKQTRVPTSRFARLISYSGLAAGLGMGALAEVTRRTLNKKTSEQAANTILGPSPFLTEANIERIVNTLCRVRGAALKLGQMLSIQDNSFINPELQKIFERVRQSADFMPKWQMKQVLNVELGHDWESKVLSFDNKPFAAASIGQVHQVTLLDGSPAAMKIQYPGVAKSIDSDINNLMSVMKVWNFIPKGVFMDNMMSVAKKELSWEVDYEREAACGIRFRELLADDPVFVIPKVYPELSTARIITTDYLEGVPVDQCSEIDQETKNWIGENLLRLTLKEVFIFSFMQTDPNWANFFFLPNTNQIGLLDFGATREFDKNFVDKYIKVIKSAADQNPDGILYWSQKLGFLTGYETKVMKDAHIDTVMILGEAFSYDGNFDFGSQSTTNRVQNLIPVMVKHRLAPPPEESYSLHRKMSGAFLICTKLKCQINCQKLFKDIWDSYKFSDDFEEWKMDYFVNLRC